MQSTIESWYAKLGLVAAHRTRFEDFDKESCDRLIICLINNKGCPILCFTKWLSLQGDAKHQ